MKSALGDGHNIYDLTNMTATVEYGKMIRLGSLFELPSKAVAEQNMWLSGLVWPQNLAIACAGPEFNGVWYEH
jgi:hypothetical protein